MSLLFRSLSIFRYRWFAFRYISLILIRFHFPKWYELTYLSTFPIRDNFPIWFDFQFVSTFFKSIFFDLVIVAIRFKFSDTYGFFNLVRFRIPIDFWKPVLIGSYQSYQLKLTWRYHRKSGIPYQWFGIILVIQIFEMHFLLNFAFKIL